MNRTQRLIILVGAFALFLNCADKPASNPATVTVPDIGQLYQKNAPYVYLAGVLITDENSHPVYVFEVGTAFKIAGGLYYTNAHVALAMHKLAGAFYPDWVSRPYQAKLVLVPSNDILDNALTLEGFSLHPEYDTSGESPDIAQLFLPYATSNQGIPVATKSEIDDLHQGQPVWTIGYPGETGYYNLMYPQPTLKTGYISALRPLQLPFAPNMPNQLIQYDMDLTGGTSGSPVFNAQGNLIAINYSGYDQGSINFGLRSDLLFTAPESQKQRFADVDTIRSHYEIIPGKSIGDVCVNARISTLTRNFVRATGTTAFYSDSLTYVIQCLTSNDSIRAMRLYEYNNDVFSPTFSTKSDLSIGANISRISGVYSPLLMRVDHVARGIDTVDISVIQSDGIAFVRENNYIKEIYVFSPLRAINFQDFTYEKKFLPKKQSSQNGVSWIKVPGTFLR